MWRLVNKSPLFTAQPKAPAPQAYGRALAEPVAPESALVEPDGHRAHKSDYVREIETVDKVAVICLGARRRALGADTRRCPRAI
jgi:hypothetical protein